MAGATSEPGFKMKFKTEICKFWQLSGTCEYADTCSFAHGAHEMKKRVDQPRNYKTKQCKRFHKELYCPYGPRCQFLHNEISAAEKKKLASATSAALTAESLVMMDAAATPFSYSDHLQQTVAVEQLDHEASNQRRL